MKVKVPESTKSGPQNLSTHTSHTHLPLQEEVIEATVQIIFEM